LLKVIVLYYSKTGNTEKMAKAVVEGVRNVQGVDVELKYQSTPEELASADAIIIGTPTYHHDTQISMKKLFEEAATKDVDLKGKIGAAFGSYGWSGEAPRLILEIMEKRFEMEGLKPPLLVKYTPKEKDLDECRKIGNNVAELILKPS
jgi:flavodoxin I